MFSAYWGTCYVATRGVISHYLTVDDDWRVDVGAEEAVDDGVKVGLEGRGRVADGDAVVGQPGVLLLHNLHHRVQTLREKVSQSKLVCGPSGLGQHQNSLWADKTHDPLAWGVICNILILGILEETRVRIVSIMDGWHYLSL